MLYWYILTLTPHGWKCSLKVMLHLAQWSVAYEGERIAAEYPRAAPAFNIAFFVHGVVVLDIIS